MRKLLLLGVIGWLCQGQIRVNVGGSQYTDTSSNVWAADTGCTSVSTYTYNGAIHGTANPTLYQTGRNGGSSLNCTYTLSATPAYYLVTLKFAETDRKVTTNTTGPNANPRLMNIYINGALYASSVNVLANAGQFATAWDWGSPTIPITDGTISVTITQTHYQPMLAAIEIDSVSTQNIPATQLTFTQAGSAVVRTVQAKLQEQPSVLDFGADPTGMSSSQAALVAALTAATNGLLTCPKGIYKQTATLSLPTAINWVGIRADTQSPSLGGCTLQWAGSAPATPYVPGSAMIEANGVYGTRLSGINCNGNGTTNLNCYSVYAAADGSTSSQRNSFKDALIQNFGNPATNTAGAGIICGRGSGSNDQADGGEFSGLYIFNVYEGIRVQSRNCDYTRYGSFAIAAVNTAIHLTNAGYASWDTWSAGTMLGANPSVIKIDGQYDTQVFKLGQAENDMGTGNPAQMLNITNAVTIYTPLIFEGNQFDFPSTIAGQAQIQFNSNTFTKTVTVNGSNNLIAGTNNYFISPATITNSGVNNVWREPDLSTCGSTVNCFDNNIAVSGFPVMTEQQSTISGISFGAHEWKMQGGQSWKRTWSSSLLCDTDHTASDFAFLCATAGMSGTDGLAMYPGYSVLNNIRVDSDRDLCYVVPSANVGGADTAITITTTNGLQPTPGSSCYFIPLNHQLTSGVANTIAVNGGTARPVLRFTNSAVLGTTISSGGWAYVILDDGGNFRAVGQ